MLHLNKLFDIDNIDVYLHLKKDNFNYLQLLFFLLSNHKNNQDIIIYFFDNKRFDISGDLNHIIFDFIAANYKTNVNRFNIMLELFNNTRFSGFHNNINIDDENFINKLIDDIKNNKSDLTIKQITKLLSNNKIFLKKYTEYLIDNIDKFKSNNLIYDKIIETVILNQNNPNDMRKLFTILADFNVQILKKYRNKLYNLLFIKIQIIKLLNNINLS